jgi:hypothetical protein
MKKKALKCPAEGCTRQVAPGDVQEHTYIGGKLRLYEGECPERGLFQERTSASARAPHVPVAVNTRCLLQNS